MHNIKNIKKILKILKRCAQQSIAKSASKFQRSTALQFRWKVAHFKQVAHNDIFKQVAHNVIFKQVAHAEQVASNALQCTCRRKSAQQLTSKNVIQSATKSAIQVHPPHATIMSKLKEQNICRIWEYVSPKFLLF